MVKNKPLQWRHYERDSVSNHQRLECLPNRLFRRPSKKVWKPRVTGLCGGIHRWQVDSPHKGPVTRKFVFHLMTLSCIPLIRSGEVLTRPDGILIHTVGIGCNPQSAWVDYYFAMADKRNSFFFTILQISHRSNRIPATFVINRVLVLVDQPILWK